MQIRLDRVQSEPFRWQETQRIPAASLDRDELEGLGEVSWEGDVTPASPGFRVTGRIHYEQVLACSRCLRPIAEPVDRAFELLVFIDPEVDEEPEVELDEQDMSILKVREEVLEMQPILIEQMQLAVPMKVLCREDCAGLCPHCGADRNESACDCEVEAIDPRWAALSEFRPGGRKPKAPGSDSDGP